MKDVETEVFGGDDPQKGLSIRVTNLENSATQAANLSAAGAVGGAPLGSSATQELQLLRKSNSVLSGLATQLQQQNRSLQNQLYVQHDRQNILNLLLGSVEELPESSLKAEVVNFFKTVLKIDSVTTKDFVKAYHKTEPRDYEDKLKLDNGQTRRIRVKAPVRLQSEVLWEQAIQKARGLGGV